MRSPAPSGPAPALWDSVTIHRPGILPLRPLAAGEVLDGAFALLRENTAAVLALSLPVAVLLRLVSIGTLFVLASSGTTTSPGVLTGLVTAAADVVLVLLLAGLLSPLLGEAVLGTRIAAGDALRRAGRTVPALLRLMVIATAMLVLPVVLAVALGVSGLPGSGGWAALVIVAGVPLLPWAAVRWLVLAAPAVALEGQGARGGLRRAARLTSGSWWRVLGIVLIATAVMLLLSTIVGLPFRLEGSSADAGSGQVRIDGTALALSTVGALLADTLTRPVLAGAVAVLYLDRRMRREGLDLTLSRTVLEGGERQQPSPAGRGT